MSKRDKEFYERQNRILEKLASINLSPNENKYCWVLFRKTFGYGKYEDRISRSQMALKTGIAETTVSDVKKRLVDKNIIQVNSKNKGFNLNTDQWEKVKVSLPFKKVKVSGLKGQGRAEEKGQGIMTYKETTKKTLQRKGNCYAKLSGKEINKLELDQWYKAIMFNEGKFSIFYIEGTIDDYPYDTRMSCWYLYEEAKDIRDKEAYFSTLLENYTKKRE